MCRGWVRPPGLMFSGVKDVFLGMFSAPRTKNKYHKTTKNNKKQKQQQKTNKNHKKTKTCMCGYIYMYGSCT